MGGCRGGREGRMARTRESGGEARRAPQGGPRGGAGGKDYGTTQGRVGELKGGLPGERVPVIVAGRMCAAHR